MFDHVTLRAADLEASAAFYEGVLSTHGIDPTASLDWLVEWDLFSLSPASAEKPVTRRLHIAFPAPTPEHVPSRPRRGAGHDRPPVDPGRRRRLGERVLLGDRAVVGVRGRPRGPWAPGG